MVVRTNKKNSQHKKPFKSTYKKPDWQEEAKIREEVMTCEGNQIENLMNDLRKERELKYIDLHLVDEDVIDLKEELILTIPQAITGMPQPRKQKHFVPEVISPLATLPEGMQKGGNSDNILQVGMSEKVHMQCSFDSETPQEDNILPSKNRNSET